MIRESTRVISITTDIIVGFPGETDGEFEETVDLLDVVRYEGVFSFKYSPRPNTLSLSMAETASEEEKGRRLAVLQERQRRIQAERSLPLLGESFELMVTNKSRRENQWSGHTSCNRVLNFTSQSRDLLGTYVQVRVTSVGPSSLVGEHIV
jgi:tRNA-2-methylthio-N6-dimethylallyladenosine synthase